jgi:hypothetical protein
MLMVQMVVGEQAVLEILLAEELSQQQALGQQCQPRRPLPNLYPRPFLLEDDPQLPQVLVLLHEVRSKNDGIPWEQVQKALGLVGRTIMVPLKWIPFYHQMLNLRL